MFKNFAALFLLSALSCQAALTFVAREPFVDPGTLTPPGVLTPTSPGSNFSSVSGTINLVRVGPRPSTVAAPGWSADFRTPGAANVRGTINLSGPASTCGMWGEWVRIKSLPPGGGYVSVLQLIGPNAVAMDFKINPSGIISVQPYDNGGTNTPTFSSPSIPLNTWVWLAVAWQIEPRNAMLYPGQNFPYGIRCMSMPLGATALTTWGSKDGLGALATSFTSVDMGLQTGGNGSLLRIGCPSLYSMTDFTDIAYPSDILPPVEGPNNWYVNPVSGKDTNDGATAGTAWQTATKLNTESQYCGLLDSNAAGPGGGDVVTIDTSSTPLVVGTNTLSFATQGLKVQPASGQTAIKFQAEEFLANSAFTPTAGSVKVNGAAQTYQTTDTQANVVAWENDKWMWHVKSASYGASAAITNPDNNATTNFASTLAALDATPGSFYTDGTNLYIHPFGNTVPNSDGKTYTRSVNRGGGLAAVAFTAGNFYALGFNIRKTALVDSGDNDFGAYCLQDGVLAGTGFSSKVENGYFAYGDKHCFGSTSGVTAASLLVLNTECEQGQAYCEFGGQTPFVSYTGATTADIVHTYKGCTCLTRSGLIGSTAGDPIGTGGDIILSHNNGVGVSFGSITLDGCNFASGVVDMGVATSLVITDGSKVGEVQTSCPNTTIQQTSFAYQLVTMVSGATNLTVKSCLIKPTFALSPAPAYFGFLLFGNVSIQGCTFDLTGITGDSGSYFLQGMIQRTGTLNLTFQNNAYVVPTGESLPLLYNAQSSDTLTFDHNAYNLGSGTVLARAYGTSSGTSNLTFAQWQGQGKDCTNSSLGANLLLQSDVPQAGSPLFNAGLSIGPLVDFTGASYPNRNTIGAYEGSSTYRAPQGIANFPALQRVSIGGGAQSLAFQYALPATTSAGLAITYTLVSGPATLSGDTLTITGVTAITLVATQAGNGTYASLSETETITPVPSAGEDTPTMPEWGLAVLALLLAAAAVRPARAELQ